MQPSPRTSVNPEEVHQEDREPEPAQEPDLAHEVYTACVEEVLAERGDRLTSDALPRVNLQREIVSYIDLVLGQAEIKTEQCEPDEISAYNQIEIIEPKLEDSSVAMAAAEGSCGVCGYSARGRRALAVHRCRVKAECKGKNGYESVDDIAESNARKARKSNKYKSPKVKNKVIISSGYFRCDSCPFTTIRKKVLDNHSKFHRQSNLDCATCGLTCSDLAELSRHSEEHVVRRTFQCRYCPFSSNYMWQLHRHRADEHPQVLPRRTPQQRRLRIPCPDCPFSCMHPSELAVHAARHHSRLQPYRCTACSYSCQGPHSLRRHTLIHTQPRSFRCDRCPYTSNLKHNLTLHRMSHTDEKPISCLVCGARFRRLFSLTVHSLIHSEKSFFCESCNFSCTHYSSLKRHRRMHEGDRRKYCPECTYACKLTESLLRHRSVEHGVKGLYPCHLCPFVADTSRQRAGHGRSHRANLIDPSLLYEKPVYSELHFVSRQSQKSKFKRGARKPGDIYVTFGDERFKMDEVPYAYSRLRIVCRRLTISEIIQRRLNHK